MLGFFVPREHGVPQIPKILERPIPLLDLGNALARRVASFYDPRKEVEKHAAIYRAMPG